MTSDRKDRGSAELQLKEEYAALPESHFQKKLRLASTGRHILISYPTDLTDKELLDFLGWCTHSLVESLEPGIAPERATLKI